MEEKPEEKKEEEQEEIQPVLSTPGPQPPTRLHKTMRSVLRWILTVVVAFGLGALAIALALYFPTRQKLDAATADLESANAAIVEKDARIATLETDNATLQTELASHLLHMHVLAALSDVRAASLAVAADDYAGARLSLTQASISLDVLSDLAEDQADVLTAMQQIVDQTFVMMKADLPSAQPGLDMLIENLVLLEKSMFPAP